MSRLLCFCSAQISVKNGSSSKLSCTVDYVSFSSVPFRSVPDTAWTIYTLNIALYFAL